MKFDGPDAYDPDNFVDDESQQRLMEEMGKQQVIWAGQNQPFLDKVFAMVKEAADKNII